MKRRELVRIFTLPVLLGFTNDNGLIGAIDAKLEHRPPSPTSNVTEVVKQFVPLGISLEAAEAHLSGAGFEKKPNFPEDAAALKASDFYVTYKAERDVIFLITSKIYVVEVGVKEGKVNYISGWVYGSSI